MLPLELMTTTLKQLAEAVVKLPADERAFLAEELLASFDDTELEKNWSEEAKRRRDEVRTGRVKPIEADDVYRRIEGILHE
jgi:putative addiction module component (TIGR02574 family)